MWYCDGCRDEFETENEALEHEKTCQKVIDFVKSQEEEKKLKEKIRKEEKRLLEEKIRGKRGTGPPPPRGGVWRRRRGPQAAARNPRSVVPVVRSRL